MRALLAFNALLLTGIAHAFLVPSAFTGQHVANMPRRATGITMKIFDWKRRRNPDGLVLDEIRPDTLKPAPGSNKRHKRKGRGISAGQGASCGFGMRGQKSRAGSGVRAGFEGGQTPLYRRIPKIVGRPMGPGHKKKVFNLIKLEDLNKVKDGATVNFDALYAAGIVTKTKYKWHKVVGGEDLISKGLIVQAHGFTKSAVAAIEANGGTCQLMSPTTNKILLLQDEDEVVEEDEENET